MKHRAMTSNIMFLRAMVMLNTYLVKEDDGVTLVDTMMAGQGAALDAVIDRAARQFGEEA